MKPLAVKASDTIQAKDSLSTYKRWFNGVKHFLTVKRLPPNN
jgi:hypothetical protein